MSEMRDLEYTRGKRHDHAGADQKHKTDLDPDEPVDGVVDLCQFVKNCSMLLSLPVLRSFAKQKATGAKRAGHTKRQLGFAECAKRHKRVERKLCPFA